MDAVAVDASLTVSKDEQVSFDNGLAGVSVHWIGKFTITLESDGCVLDTGIGIVGGTAEEFDDVDRFTFGFP